jgi:FkbH-like protein
MKPTASDCRATVQAHLESGQWSLAKACLHQLWNASPTAATAAYVTSCFEQLRPHLNLVPCRIALVRSFTVEPAIPFLRAQGFLNGLDVVVHVGDFNAYTQEILSAEGPLYAFNPQAVMLAVQTRDIAPEIWDEYADHESGRLTAVADQVVESYRELVTAFRNSSGAALIIHGLEVPAAPSCGVADLQHGRGQIDLIRSINTRLQLMAQEQTGVYILDYDALTGRWGKQRWFDSRKFVTMAMPVSADCLLHLAGEWLRYLHPISGRIGKVLVTDLDNTLWGGVVGEDGAQGIQVGRSYPGSIYLSLQRAILDLHHRGILLAAASKNNRDDALEALAHHPGMLLRPEHFSALHLDWSDKVASLRLIAEELNVGIDSLVFLDDNEAERQRVRQALPDVFVVELPQDPQEYASALRNTPVFERLTTSAEDARRHDYYAAQGPRNELRRSCASLEEFYASLDQRVEIAALGAETLTRAAQLTQKTNQFNMTTKRFTEPQLAEIAGEAGRSVYTVRVSDRFGDNGVVGVCMTKTSDSICTIDTFLLSCRVIGRTVETAVLAFLAERCRAAGIEQLRGVFVPTKRNKPAEKVYADHGFKLAEENGAGSVWTLQLRSSVLRCPPWIQMHHLIDSKETVRA